MSSTPSQRPKDFENLEFETLEEKWNEYELQNGTKVRGRVIITRFFRNPHDPDPNRYSLSSKNFFVVDAPVEQRGDPSPPLTMEERQNPQGPSVQILTNNEQWNRYRILRTGMVLKVKLVVSDAMRLTDKFDADCMPQYVFRSAPMIVPDQTENSSRRT